MCFYHPIAAVTILLLATAGLTSCEKRSPEEYSERHSLVLSEVSQRLLQNDLKGAKDVLQKQGSMPETLLLELLTAAEQEQALLLQASEHLQQGQYHTLSNLLTKAEKDGQATPELLKYRAIPQALQALQLFCQRMPWESSEDLSNALTWLQPYTPVLEQSPAFQRFWQQQHNFLEPLQQRELQRKCDSLTAEIDLDLCQNRFTDAWAASARLYALHPAHPLFSFLDWSQKSLHAQLPPLPPESSEQQEACELALVLCWGQLSATQRKRLLFPLSTLAAQSFRTVSGLSLLALYLDSPEWLTLAFQRWQEQASEKETLPFIFREYMLSLLPRPEQFAASCRQYTCPGFSDFFTCLNLLLSPVSTTNQRK